VAVNPPRSSQKARTQYEKEKRRYAVTEFHYDQAIQHSLWTHGRDETDSTEQRRENVKQLRERLELSGAYNLSNKEPALLV
jgi:hypothetical protein